MGVVLLTLVPLGIIIRVKGDIKPVIKNNDINVGSSSTLVETPEKEVEEVIRQTEKENP